MNKRKILVLGRSLEIGGVEKALVGFINSFDLESNSVYVLLAIKDGLLTKSVKPGIKWLETPSWMDWIMLRKDRVLHSILSLIKHPVILFYYLKNIVEGLLTGRMAEARQKMWNDCIDYIPSLDIVFDEVYDFSGLFRKYALDRVNSERKFTWVHSDYRVFGYNKKLDYVLLERFDEICCVSESCLKIFNDEFPELSHKSKVVQNIIDKEMIERQALEGEGFKDDFDGLRLLDVTRIDPNKGLDIAVKVCKKLIGLGVNIRWYILGNDPLNYKKNIEKVIKDEGMEKYFILLGFTSNPYPFMKQCDVIVHFSRFEGRSVAIDEALALNKTILLTNYPTAKDQIQDGVNGFICDFEEEKLVQKLISILKNNQKN